MVDNTHKIGFSYLSSPKFLLEKQLNLWFPSLQKWGSSFIIIAANFDLAVPEDFFIHAQHNGLNPVVHFKTTLPSARAYNETSPLLDLYKKWGVKYVILGDQPNTQKGWPIAGWHYETLVESFLDRFIPLANHAVRIGLCPIMAPLKPGGDYWDPAFMEMILSGLKQRKMESILDNLTLSSYGYTFYKPLTWGEGGPEQWPGSKPYLTPEGQEDQMGFQNYAWVQAASQRITGNKLPVVILDAGRPGPTIDLSRQDEVMGAFRKIAAARSYPQAKEPAGSSELALMNDLVVACVFNLDTLKAVLGEAFSIEELGRIFGRVQIEKRKPFSRNSNHKYLDHYLLLPSYPSGVSDVVLNKVRPLIKKLRPTVGFSLEEASRASRVSIFPDPILFKDEQINQLRAAGCKVEILPQSGIEIATLLQE